MRKQQKLSIRELATKAGLNHTSLSRLEHGTVVPRPDTLKALAVALGIPLADLFTMADYVTPYDLPSLAPYLRTRYGHLPEDKLNEINSYLERLIDEFNLDPSGPLDLEDETNEASPH